MIRQLLEFAKSEIVLNAEQADGATLRHHLNVIWKRTGKKPKQLEDAVSLPPLVAHVWAWFLDLCQDRPSTGFGSSRISAEVVKNWCWFTGNRLELWERRAIRKLDQVWTSSRKQ